MKAPLSGRPAHLKRTQTHGSWDHSIVPVLHIAPGDTVVVELQNASGGQLRRDSAASELAGLDLARINPVTGPIFVEGAKPGDALVVEILELDVDTWGWTANIPGFGLLADEFKEPALHLWKYEAKTLAPAMFGRWGLVPLKPFTGTIGLAPAAKLATNEPRPVCPTW